MRESLENFKVNLGQVVIFEMAYRILTMFILIPINYFILEYFIKNTGVDVISNKEILKFSLTKEGIFCIGILLIISFLMVFFEIGALTYIGVKSHRKEKVKLLEGVVNSFNILKDTIGFSIIPLIIIVGFVGPWFSMGMCSSLIKEFTIPPFVTIELSKTLGGKILYGIIIVVLILLLLRWILAIPTIAIEKVRGKKALKKSYKMYKKNRIGLLSSIIFWEIGIGILRGLLFGGITLFGIVIGNMLGDTTFKAKVFLIFMITIFTVIYVIVSLLYTGLFTQFLISIYYRLRSEDCIERKFIEKVNYNEKKAYTRIEKIKRIIPVIIVILFAGVTIYNLNSVNIRGKINKEVEITAHRGSSNAPENTMAAVKEAVKEGADYAEIDVMTTKDNEVVLFHDKTLKRIDGTNRKIKEMDLDEVSEVDAGSYYSNAYKGEKIPTLEEILKESKGKIKLNIELKPMKDNDKLVEEVVELIKKYNMEDDVVISSIDYKSLEETERLAPELKTGFVLLAMAGDIGLYNVDFVSVESSRISQSLVYAFKALGKEVHVFTVNNDNLAEKMIYDGVDNIITDKVQAIKNTIEDMKKEKKKDYVTMYYDGILNITKYLNI
ncbi:MAG: glycerophosphoryl diester phosphodiesterase membrane domain-containing protein [Clostridium sp.]|uniref:glycerophosphoryl diester phosphodiesterase membrane domain-containing protein n=1 Tax=Clostridium sp. TaxID=1506 RepID=UPI003F2BC939